MGLKFFAIKTKPTPSLLIKLTTKIAGERGKVFAKNKMNLYFLLHFDLDQT